MTIEAITEDDILHWRCVMLDPLDGEIVSCGEMKSCHIDEAAYVIRDPSSPRGSTITLPRCQCGTQMFLKADYTLKELWHEVVVFTDELRRPQVYALPLQYVRNLCVHWMLYERGRAAYAPVLPMPTREVLEYPQFTQIRNPDGVYALWFGFAVARQYVPALSRIEVPMFLPPAK